MNKERQNHNEIYNNSIDTNLEQLEQRINEINKNPGICGYEKDKNGKFYAVYNGQKLDIPLKNPEKLLDVLKVLKHSVETYLKAGYQKEKLYVSTNGFMSGKYLHKTYYDIFVDNRDLGILDKIDVNDNFNIDTAFLRDETIENLFGNNRNGFYSKKIANFLNNVLGNSEEKNKK